MMWDRSGVLPRHLIFVEVTHVKAPYVEDSRYQGDQFLPLPATAAGSSASNCASASWRSRMSRNGWKASPATSRSTCRRSSRRWIVHVAHENLLPPRHASLWRLLRFRLFLFLRLISRPAYYAYGLGDAVQLSAEVMPVRVSRSSGRTPA